MYGYVGHGFYALYVIKDLKDREATLISWGSVA